MYKTQIPEKFQSIIEDQINNYYETIITEELNYIPDTSDIPLIANNSKKWLKIKDIICVYVDMRNSTKLSNEKYLPSMAKIYELFTGTAVKLFHEFDAKYIDVRGDGVFALYNQNQPYHAIASAITFKTFSEEYFEETIQSKDDVIGAHIGIDRKTVFVKKVGLKRIGGRTDRQNEIWAGQTINAAAKLCTLCEPMELIVSDRFYEKITNNLVRLSCDCSNETMLWEEVDLSYNNKFKFNKAWKLNSKWCRIHGSYFCNSIINLDEN
ncbi:MAG: hypothetical protein NT007_13945 [Candidatus Kapabacteria bacterium]|nr:hypothetical protein [Candidatus Kapabacteria bacterium]